MTTKPSYIIHEVDEKDVTVDWFFGGRHDKQAEQIILVLLGWVFVILPMVITASAIVNRDNDDRGWWGYHEGLVMWDITMLFLGILAVVFAVGFLVLTFLDHRAARQRDQHKTYDEQRLDQRLEVAADWYADKYGPEPLRQRQTRIQIEPYSDVETYELRGLYRAKGVD